MEYPYFIMLSALFIYVYVPKNLYYNIIIICKTLNVKKILKKSILLFSSKGLKIIYREFRKIIMCFRISFYSVI